MLREGRMNSPSAGGVEVSMCQYLVSSFVEPGSSVDLEKGLVSPGWVPDSGDPPQSYKDKALFCAKLESVCK